MRENDKIHVANYLKDLNERSKHAITYGHLDRKTINPITCKQLAELCEVTPATIANLTTSSKFYLIDKIAGEILDAYYGYFCYQEREERKEYPDEVIYPKDKNYVLMCLTNYYTDEFMNY